MWTVDPADFAPRIIDRRTKMDTSFAMVVVVYVFLIYSIVAENWNFSALRRKQLSEPSRC